MKTLATVGCICALFALVFLPPILAGIAMLFGVGLIAKAKVEQGIAIIVLACACGYFGISSGASLNSSFGGMLWGYIPVESLLHPDLNQRAADQGWRLVSLESQATKTQDGYWVCSWKLTVRNDSAHPATFHGSIEFQDAQGAPLGSESVNADRAAPVAGGSEGIFTGSQLIRTTTKVARAVPKIAKDS